MAMLKVVALMVLAVVLSVGFTASAQVRDVVSEATERFEVASVRPNKNGADSAVNVSFPADRFSAQNVTLQLLIMLAYERRELEIVGGPSWLTSDRFDVVAT